MNRSDNTVAGVAQPRPLQPERVKLNVDTSLGRLVTIQKAAEELGIHAWALRRAVKRGDVPSYQGFNSRRLVRVDEVVAVINATRHGGL